MYRVVQDVQQLRSLLQQQSQIEQQCINLCNRIEQSAMQAAQIPLQSQQVIPFHQAGLGFPGATSQASTYNPSVLNQVMATEQQFRAQQTPTTSGPWQ